METLAVGYHTE